MSRKHPRRPSKRNAHNNTGRAASPRDERTEETPIYLTGNSTLQTSEEHQRDAATDPREDRSIDVNRDDLHEIRLGRMTGRDSNDSDKA